MQPMDSNQHMRVKNLSTFLDHWPGNNHNKIVDYRSSTTTTIAVIDYVKQIFSIDQMPPSNSECLSLLQYYQGFFLKDAAIQKIDQLKIMFMYPELFTSDSVKKQNVEETVSKSSIDLSQLQHVRLQKLRNFLNSWPGSNYTKVVDYKLGQTIPVTDYVMDIFAISESHPPISRCIALLDLYRGYLSAVSTFVEKIDQLKDMFLFPEDYVDSPVKESVFEYDAEVYEDSFEDEESFSSYYTEYFGSDYEASTKPSEKDFVEQSITKTPAHIENWFQNMGK